ncbi:hypothetical protein Daus18300_008041 [Diaporthe australafricana]|uniref:Xylanolytic transcriptional activator regulatory domain-containing protein n=1 Tax=Diaporthe australafricana TaxID=127596 RepID=A0ABR3WK91_9PEZI
MSLLSHHANKHSSYPETSENVYWLYEAKTHQCKRELVRVRGNLVKNSVSEDPGSRNYAELLQENAVLRALLAGQDARGITGTSKTDGKGTLGLRAHGRSRTEEVERRLFDEIGTSSETRIVRVLEDVILPSQDFSRSMIGNAFEWTFWIHFALFIPKFRREHEDFCDWLRAKKPLSEFDPAWMAIYFSVLASTLMFMDEKETDDKRPAGVDFTSLLRNWYESALLFLDTADYIKSPDVRTVQAIAILNIVFNNVGDVHRHQNMWTVAIRQAQQLGLGSDEDNTDESYCEQQIRKRLWWTLVICEWIPVPHRAPCLHEIDFSCKLPDEVDDDELETTSGNSRLPRSKPRPVRYHIAMAEVSRIYYRLRYMLRLREWKTEDVARLVFNADEQLANLITDLPSYLQSDEKQTAATDKRDNQHPFIPWQKKSLAKVLLYYRMAVSSQLQEHWLDGSTDGARTRAICMSSARGLIHSTLTETADASKLRPWAITMNIFAASAVLALESLHTEEDFSAEIQQGLDFLEGVQAQNLVAEKAIRLLKDIIQNN